MREDFHQLSLTFADASKSVANVCTVLCYQVAGMRQHRTRVLDSRLANISVTDPMRTIACAFEGSRCVCAVGVLVTGRVLAFIDIDTILLIACNKTIHQHVLDMQRKKQ